MSSDRGTPRERDATDPLVGIGGMGVVLALFLGRTRLWAAGLSWKQVASWGGARQVLELTYYDVLYVAVATGACAGAILLVRGRPQAVRIIRGLYGALAGLSLVLAYVNAKALKELGSPLTYQWLYYSDFLRSIDAYNAMRGLASWGWMRAVLLSCVELLLACYVAVRGLRWLTSRVAVRWVITPGMTGLCLALGLGHLGLPPVEADRVRLQNPIVRLIGSALQKDENPLLTTMPTAVPPTDFLPLGARPPREGDRGGALRQRARAAGVRNVLLLVLESTGAEYVGAYGAAYGATPYLDSYRPQAMLFTRVYAHVPSTVHSLVALLLSIYHPHTFRVLTAEYPRVRLPSIGTELGRQGYRTAFFNASDNRFQREDVFLTGRFDQLEDYRTYRCAGQVFRASDRLWQYLDGAPDACAVDPIVEWTGDGSAPFFGVFWTGQTHFPYFVTGSAGEFGVRDADLNRYLGALRETDRAIGDLLARLERRGVLDSTLVVVVGDHGEAFGQHGHYVHGVDLYEEEVHVPLMLINRRLFHGETDSTLGGMIDVAPTILDLLGAAPPASWQGRSLFDSLRTPRVYLFTSRSKVLFGYREGDQKFIYDAGSNRAELYDLAEDPAESSNVIAAWPGTARAGRERLAAWVQFQRRFLADVLVPDAR